MTPTDDSPAPLSTSRQASLASYWLGYNLQWAALLAIVLPSQVALLAGDAAVFAVSAAWCLLGTVLVSRIRGAR